MFPARYLRSCQEEGRRAAACHRRVPSCRSLNVTFRASTLEKQRHGQDYVWRYLMGISWTKNLVEGPRIWALLPHVVRAARRRKKRRVDTK